MTTRRALVAAPAIAIYLVSVLLANWLTARYGFVDVGFGYIATAGTFVAGGALVVRDLVQDAVGRRGVLLLILIGAALSFVVATPAIAVASAVAFGCAELMDMVVYTPLRKRGRFGGPWWSRAVVAGAVLGAVVDTVLFLWIAFGAGTISAALPGQLLAKGEVVLLLLAIGVVSSGEVLRESIDGRRA